MSDRKRFLGGAAAGLFLAVAIVAAISLGTASLTSPNYGAGTAVKTFSGSTTTTTSAAVQVSTPSNLSGGSSPFSRPSASATTTASTMTSQTTSASQVPPSQMDNTSTTGPPTSNPGISFASLIQTLPAVAIALVLGIAVYQFSVRRVDRTDAIQRTR